MSGGRKSRCVGRVQGADGAVPHGTIQNSVQKTICWNSTYNVSDDGRMYQKHVKLRTYQ